VNTYQSAVLKVVPLLTLFLLVALYLVQTIALITRVHVLVIAADIVGTPISRGGNNVMAQIFTVGLAKPSTLLMELYHAMQTLVSLILADAIILLLGVGMVKRMMMAKAVMELI
jgi:hypothetical protein